MEVEEKLLKGLHDSRADVRLQTSGKLLEFFREHDPQELQELERFIAGLSVWANSSNFKVVLGAMDVLELLSQKLRDKFKHHIVAVLPSLRERLGDAKEVVRDRAQLLLQHFMQPAISGPQFVLDRLMPHVLGHKNWRVREQGLLCLSKTLDNIGTAGVSVGKFVGAICKLLGDANSQVRACAIETLVDIYRYAGDKVRKDLQRRGLPDSRLANIMERFDEVDTANKRRSSSTGSADDVPSDTLTPSVAPERSRQSTAIPTSSVASASASVSRPQGRPPSGATASKISSHRVAGSGAVTREDFEKTFLETPVIDDKDLPSVMSRLEAGLSDPKTNWTSHLALLQQLRGVAASSKEPLDGFLRTLENPLCVLVKDLRSQVLRETCITISYLSRTLRRRFDHPAEVIAPVLITVLQASTKVMSSSCDLCMRYILENTHNPRLIPVVATGMSSKAVTTRNYCAEYCDIVVHTWEPPILERQLQVLSDMIKAGISDASQVARQFMRRAFWGLHEHFEPVAARLEQSLGTTHQHYLREERKNMTNPQFRPRQVPMRFSSAPLASKKSKITASEPDLLAAVENERPAEATVVHRKSDEPLKGSATSTLTSMSKLSRSVEELEMPSSPPKSEVGSKLATPFRTPTKIPGLSVTHHKTPSTKDYTQYGSLPRPRKHKQQQPRQSGLTKEAMLSVYGSSSRGQGDDASETGSIGSDRSGFSITSEFSALSPYVKYPTPVTDLGELLTLCSSSKWSERRDGIAQLQLLLESSRELLPADINKIKAISNRLFSEPHTKVYSSFLDVLAIFLEQKAQMLDDWLFVVLLRLIHKQGSDNLSSVVQKMTVVLDMVRATFAPHIQFLVMCRILTDPSQPMNNRVKLAWLEYFLLLVPLMEASEFENTLEVRPALGALLKMTSEPKSMEIRKSSKRAVVSLFDLNAASMSLMLRQQPQALQDSADRILKSYVQSSSSSEESESPAHSSISSATSHGSVTGTKASLGLTSMPQQTSKGRPASTSKATASATPDRRSRSKTPSSPMRKSPSLSNLSTANSGRPITPSSLTRQRISSTPTATPTRNLRTSGGTRAGSTSGGTGGRLQPPSGALSKQFSTSHPDMRSIGAESNQQLQQPQKAPRMGRTLSGQSIAIRRASSRSSLGNHSAPAKPAPVMPRSQSVEPMRKSQEQQQMYSPTNYQNENETANPSLFTFLPELNFGSPETEDPYDHVSAILKQLNTADSDSAKISILWTLLGISRERKDACNWKENFNPVLLKLIELLEGTEVELQVLSLRILREMIKSSPTLLKDYSEMIIIKVTTAYCNASSEVSRTAEDVVEPLAEAVDPRASLELLGPMLLTEEHPLLVVVIKLLAKIIPNCSKELLLGKIQDLSQGLVKAFSHSESAVRKVSVFCMVSLHSVVGEELKSHLSKLSSSQMKLLDLYIKKQAANGHL